MNNNQNVYLDNIKIIKSLGKGMHGTIYLVKNIDTKTKYAMKAEKVFKKDIKKSFKSVLWREIARFLEPCYFH